MPINLPRPVSQLFDRYYKGYRATSTRLAGWDYSSPGGYFITICTAFRKPSFGVIQDNKVLLNRAGNIALECWREMPDHLPFVRLDEFVVLPGHLHGILFLTHPGNDEIHSRRFGCKQEGSLGYIIQTYKAAATRLIRREGIAFTWQRNYYDHVIRNDRDLDRIRQYIRSNPLIHGQS